MGNTQGIVACDYMADRLVFERRSHFPSQIRLKPIGLAEYHNYALNNFVDLIPKCALFEEVFDFERLPYSVSRRFIELLPSATLFFFSQTSKHSYKESLDLRGLEYSSYTVESYAGCDHAAETVFCGFTGRRESMRCIHKVTDKWTDFCVIQDVLSCDFYSKNAEIAQFPQTYKTLKLVFDKDTFNHNYRLVAEQLIHQNLDTVRVIFKDCDDEIQSPILLHTFVHFLDFFKNVKKMQIDFGSCLLGGDPAFSTIRSSLEDWGSQRLEPELFLLSYKHSDYKLDAGLLRVVLRLGHEWFLCSGYDDDRVAALAIADSRRGFWWPPLAAYQPMSEEALLTCQHGSDCTFFKNNFRFLSK